MKVSPRVKRLQNFTDSLTRKQMQSFRQHLKKNRYFDTLKVIELSKNDLKLERMFWYLGICVFIDITAIYDLVH